MILLRVSIPSQHPKSASKPVFEVQKILCPCPKPFHWKVFRLGVRHELMSETLSVHVWFIVTFFSFLKFYKFIVTINYLRILIWVELQFRVRWLHWKWGEMILRVKSFQGRWYFQPVLLEKKILFLRDWTFSTLNFW